MDEVTAEIKAVCKKLEEVEAEINQAQDEHNNEEVAALRKEKEQLRKKEEQLRAEKLLLLERERGSPGEVLSLLKSLQESQLEMKESQLEIKEVVTVFSAAALDLWAGCSTTNTERDRFRDELITHYEAAASGGLRCMVSGCVMESSALNAAHIWPARARNSLATMFSLTLADLDSYRNGILMTASLEKQFDAQRVAFSYDVLHDTFFFHVLDRRLNQETPKGLSMKFEALENKALLHPPGKMPFRRLLVWHYASALMKAKSAGWLDDDALAKLPRVPPKEQWMKNRSPGAKMPNEYAFWPALARSMVDETRRASDAEDDD